MTECILAGGTGYDDVRIINIPEACVTVLQLNEQRGTPRRGQKIKITVSCNKKKREREREREGGVLYVCTCAHFSSHFQKSI